jgi:hypothetical protein
MVALHPFDEFERTGANRIARRVTAFDGLLVDDLAVGSQVGQERICNLRILAVFALRVSRICPH